MGLGGQDPCVAEWQHLLPPSEGRGRQRSFPLYADLTSAFLFSPQELSSFWHRPPRPPSGRDFLVSSPPFHDPIVGDPEHQSLPACLSELRQLFTAGDQPIETRFR